MDTDGSLRADLQLGFLGALLSAVGAALMCYAALRFVWRQVTG